MKKYPKWNTWIEFEHWWTKNKNLITESNYRYYVGCFVNNRMLKSLFLKQRVLDNRISSISLKDYALYNNEYEAVGREIYNTVESNNPHRKSNYIMITSMCKVL